MPTTIIINLAQPLEPEQQTLLYNILKNMDECSILKANIDYPCNKFITAANSNITHFKLTHNILRYLENDEFEFYYAIFKRSKRTRLGKGSLSKVYEIEKTIKLNNEKIILVIREICNHGILGSIYDYSLKQCF